MFLCQYKKQTTNEYSFIFFLTLKSSFHSMSYIIHTDIFIRSSHYAKGYPEKTDTQPSLDFPVQVKAIVFYTSREVVGLDILAKMQRCIK